VCLNAEPWHVIDKSLYGLPGIAFGRALTAYLAAAITRPVRVDEPHVVIGWLQSPSGRSRWSARQLSISTKRSAQLPKRCGSSARSHRPPGHDLTAANHVDDSSLTTERNPR
jgi:hypothetical protein